MLCMAALLCAALLVVCQIYTALLGAPMKVEEQKKRQMSIKDD